MLQRGAHEQRGRQLGRCSEKRPPGCALGDSSGTSELRVQAWTVPWACAQLSSVYRGGQFPGQALKCFFADSTGSSVSLLTPLEQYQFTAGKRKKREKERETEAETETETERERVEFTHKPPLKRK